MKSKDRQIAEKLNEESIVRFDELIKEYGYDHYELLNSPVSLRCHVMRAIVLIENERDDL